MPRARFPSRRRDESLRKPAVEFIHADGAHVVWADASSSGREPTTVWSNTPDGAHPVALGAAPRVTQLATDGSSAYWAASAAGDEYSDIVTASLEGGPTRKIAYRVHAVYVVSLLSSPS